MAAPIYRRHSAGLAATFADLENQALAQDTALVGTPGAITLRKNADGVQFYTRQYYDHDRNKREQYLFASNAPDAQRRMSDWRGRINEAKDVRTSVRLLAREGYLTLSPKHLASLAPVAAHGIFRAGGMLVGTHAFEVIVNRLGIRASAFPTEDVDIARPSKLALQGIPEGGLLEILRESGIDFVAVPPLDPGERSIKFKEKGRSRFTVDLLVPSSTDEYEVHPVPELGAHAVALPYLRYLLRENQESAAISNHGVVAVRVPLPERFALHKLLVSQLRVGRSEKSQKDLRQAATLIAALAEMLPGALEAAFEATPISARTRIARSLAQIRGLLEPHPLAWEALAPLVAK